MVRLIGSLISTCITAKLFSHLLFVQTSEKVLATQGENKKLEDALKEKTEESRGWLEKHNKLEAEHHKKVKWAWYCKLWRYVEKIVNYLEGILS